MGKPKYGKRDIAFRCVLTCAHDGCMVTGEIQKGKYVYYRCSHGRGPGDLPRFKEQEVSARMGKVLRDIYVPEEIALRIETSLRQQQTQAQNHRVEELATLNRKLNELRRRQDAAYEDKLNGTITEEFWQRKQAEWQMEELRLKALITGTDQEDTEQHLLDVHRIFELAQTDHSLYLTRNPAEQANLLKLVLSNCSIDAVSLYPTYRKPFDLIAKRAKFNEWSGREDSNLRPPAPEAGALPG